MRGGAPHDGADVALPHLHLLHPLQLLPLGESLRVAAVDVVVVKLHVDGAGRAGFDAHHLAALQPVGCHRGHEVAVTEAQSADDAVPDVDAPLLEAEAQPAAVITQQPAHVSLRADRQRQRAVVRVAVLLRQPARDRLGGDVAADDERRDLPVPRPVRLARAAQGSRRRDGRRSRICSTRYLRALTHIVRSKQRRELAAALDGARIGRDSDRVRIVVIEVNVLLGVVRGR